MKAHTSNFKNEIATFGRELDSVITYEFDGETIELGNEQLNSVSPHYEGAILKSVMKQLDIESTVEIPLETQINYRFGIKVRDDEVQDYRDNYDYIDYGNYIVYKSEKQEDTGSYKITCYDKMLYSMVKYEDMQITYPITIRNYINTICNHLGLIFKNASDTFANYNKEIQNELFLDSEGGDLNYTFRDVLDQLAEATASTICIDENDNLEIRYINNTQDTIDEEYLKNINVSFSEKYGPINSIVLSRSAESDNVYLRDEESVLQDGLCELKIIDNQIMNWNDRSDYLQDILDQLDGLEYYLNDFASTGICYYDLCDRYNIQIDEETYSCVMFNDEVNITTGMEENIYTDMPSETQTDYTKADKTDRRINQTYIIVDKQEGEIQELASKIVDVSEEKTGIGIVILENAHKGILHKLSIIGNISLLYPRNDLYPKNTLYPISAFSLKIDNTYYNLDIDYLNYMSSTIYDEFIYKDGKCNIIRRVGINNGEMYALQDEIIEPREDIILNVDTNSNISSITFPNVILNVEYLLENKYTDTFASQVEVKSEIKATADGINLEVSKKVDANEIISKINQTPEQISINANKIKLEGYTTINNGFSIDENGNASMHKARITGGRLLLDPGETTANLKIGEAEFFEDIIMLRGSDSYQKDSQGHDLLLYETTIQRPTYDGSRQGIISLTSGQNEDASLVCDKNGSHVNLRNDNNVIWLDTNGIDSNEPYLDIYSNNGRTFASTDGIRSPAFINTSTKDTKKNIKDFKKNALNLIKNTDLYEYNYKGEKTKDKKHIGIVIGKNYNYPKDILSNDGKGVDLYSMVSICFKAIQEQQEQIDTLKKEIEKLKEEK